MPSRTVSTLAMYSSGWWSETMGPRGAAERRPTSAPSRAMPRGGNFAAREFVAEALDLLRLAIHEPDVVAQEQVQVLVAVARQLALDGLELEQQVVAEGADQPQARILLAAEFLDQRAQNGKHRGLLAALLLRKQARQRAQAAGQNARLPAEVLPVRMAGQHRLQDLRHLLAARVERADFHAAVVGDDFERRANGGDVPARIPARIFVAGGEIDAALPVERAQQRRQPLAEARLASRCARPRSRGESYTDIRACWWPFSGSYCPE